MLFDPKTGQIYTPNTNAYAQMGANAAVPVDENVDLTAPESRDIIEERGWVTIGGRHVLLDKNSGSGGGGSNALSKEQKALQEAINAGKVSTKLYKEKQAKHKKGSDDYKKALAKGEFPSYTELSNMEVQKIINENSGKVLYASGKTVRLEKPSLSKKI